VFYVVLVVHMVLCVAIIGLVLIQQGKGASVGVSFGGGSNTIFGAAGAGNVLTRMTTTFAVLFMVTSLVLIKMYAGAGTERGASSVDPLKGSVMERSASESAASSSEQAAPPQAPVQAPAASAPASAQSGAAEGTDKK